MLGIDIASYQSRLNLSTAKNSGIETVIIKATEGVSYKNPCMQTHVEQAKANGLNFGLYHYYSPSNGAEEQAKFFCDTIRGLGYNVIPVLDFEDKNISDKSNNINKFMNYCKNALGVTPVLYTYASFLNYLDSSTYQYKLWVAFYMSMSSTIENLDRCKQLYPIVNNYTLCGYQFASCYRINGYGGNLDVDRFYDNILLGSANVASSAPVTPVTSISPHDYLGTDHKRRFLQYCLNALGYNLAIDGIIGTNSTNAIKDFQARHGLVVDGLVGKNTWSCIKACMPTCRRGNINNAVEAIQYLLNCGIDGNFGPKTESAVRWFQKQSNIGVDGIVGQDTWGRLFGFCFV